MHIALCSKAKCPSATSTRHIPVTNTMHIPRNIHWDKKEHTQYAQCAQHAICTKAKAIRPWYRCGAETSTRLYQARRHIGRQPMNKSIRQNLWIKSPKSASIRYNPKNERQEIDFKTVKGRESESAGSPRFSPILGLWLSCQWRKGRPG